MLSLKWKLASWTILASGLNFLSSFLLASLYNVEAFGYYASVLAISTLGSFIFTLRADLFSVEDDAFPEVAFISAIILLFLIPFSLIYNDGLVVILWGFSISLFSICTYKSISKGNQLLIGYFRVLNVILIITAQFLCLYIFSKKNSGLYIGAAIGSLLTSVIYFFVVMDEYYLRREKFLLLKSRCKSYASASFSWLLDNLLLFFIPLCSVYIFTIEELGYFNFAERFFKAPVGVLVSSIVPFYIAKLAKESVISSSLLLTQWYRVLVILIPFMLVIVLILPKVVEFFWGGKWLGSLSYIYPLAVFYTFYILSSSTAYVYVKFDKYSYYIAMQLSLVLVVIFISLIGFDDLYSFYIMFMIAYVIFQFVNLLTQLKVLNGKND